HEYGIYGGTQGEYVLDLVRALNKPAVATLHTVLHAPNPDQKRVLQELAELCEVVVVMVRTGRQILIDSYGIDPKKITIIQHGVPNVHRVSTAAVKRSLGIADRKILSTFGLINRGKGIEFAIEAVARVREKHPNVLYLVLGETHPGVRAWEGETYRNDLLELVRRLNLENHVRFNNRFLTLTELVRYLFATDVYVTPYLNKDQIVSGTLAYALGCGKAIVSTPYLYAEEVLADGRGVLVDLRSPDAMANAIIDLLDNPEKKENMEALAYKFGRRTAWFNVAIDYLDLFHRILQRNKAAQEAVQEKETMEVKK
ncbi:MAG TPA: glycosyltransferase family 4 protein, partial [Armatimonadota bacterium]|nr:glycosyltransferase family 4 protein [Armatimonadota bacterium]